MAAEPSDQWWAAIIHQFQAHVREEGALLDEYQQLIDSAGDPGTKFLLEMILADEHRHHARFEEMAAAARGDGDGDGGGDGALPGGVAPDRATAAALAEPTRRLIEAEREDQRELKRLQSDLSPLRDDTLWQLLVELMVIDTQKHLVILEYLERRLRAAARS